jgi:hypothetical protein
MIKIRGRVHRTCGKYDEAYTGAVKIRLALRLGAWNAALTQFIHGDLRQPIRSTKQNDASEAQTSAEYIRRDPK